jgi:hypothetical protein
MNVTDRPLADRLSASSDLDEKLVTTPSLPSPGGGTERVFTRCPDGVSCSRKIGEVTPKLASTESLFHTPG